MRKITSFAALLLLLLVGNAGRLSAQTVTLDCVGESIESLDEIVDGGQYMIWMEAANGNERHGLVYVKSHTCSATGDAAGNTNNRIAADNSYESLPTSGTEVKASSIFTVEVDRTGETPAFAFKTVNNLYIDGTDRNAGSAGDPIHESAEKGWFYLVKSCNYTITEADLWALKTVVAGSKNRVYVNTGGADNTGLVLYTNANSGEDSRLRIIPVGHTMALTPTANLGNVATFSHNYGSNLLAPAGVTVYTVKVADTGTAQLLPVGSQEIPAGVGVVLASESATRASLVQNASTAAVTYPDNDLVALPAGGVPDDPSTAYVFTLTDSNDAVFRALSDADQTFAANKAYLANTGSGAEQMSIVLGGATTGVATAVKAEAGAQVYDLSGRRVQKPLKGGLYIRNGKKFLAE
ncbi:MAG: hypothetical protein ACI353_00920 [Alloprevotella sp.]